MVDAAAEVRVGVKVGAAVEVGAGAEVGTAAEAGAGMDIDAVREPHAMGDTIAVDDATIADNTAAVESDDVRDIPGPPPVDRTNPPNAAPTRPASTATRHRPPASATVTASARRTCISKPSSRHRRRPIGNETKAVGARGDPSKSGSRVAIPPQAHTTWPPPRWPPGTRSTAV
jgi:hypothetical protein